eukprot:5008707-Amphidinium_carterae.1
MGKLSEESSYFNILHFSHIALCNERESSSFGFFGTRTEARLNSSFDARRSVITKSGFTTHVHCYTQMRAGWRELQPRCGSAGLITRWKLFRKTEVLADRSSFAR